MKIQAKQIPANYKALGVKTYNELLTVNNCTQMGIGDEGVKKLIAYMQKMKIKYVRAGMVRTLVETL